MNTTELIEHLSRANPVSSDPAIPPIEPLLSRLDRTGRGFDDPIQPQARRASRPRARIAIASVVTAAVALGVLATFGSSGGGAPNVLADVYRALTPGTGVLHMVRVNERTAGGTTSIVREEIWTAQNPRRLRSINTPPDGKTFEHAFSASPLENRRWSEEEPDVVVHEGSNGPLVQGALTHEATPVTLLRELVKNGGATLSGKTTLEGRAVWQLTIHPENYTQPVFEGKQLPDPTVYVDASTFAPVETLGESLTHVGEKITGALEPQVETTRYTTYEETPTDAQSEALLKLAEHPGAVEKTD